MERIRAGRDERRLGWENMKYHDKGKGTERRGAERVRQRSAIGLLY
jgi:hypothetical protein